MQTKKGEREGKEKSRAEQSRAEIGRFSGPPTIRRSTPTSPFSWLRGEARLHASKSLCFFLSPVHALLSSSGRSSGAQCGPASSQKGMHRTRYSCAYIPPITWLSSDLPPGTHSHVASNQKLTSMADVPSTPKERSQERNRESEREDDR